MNKQRFIQIVSGQEVIVKDDLKKIQVLEKDYPYSQVLHTLSAIGSYKNKLQNSRQKLHLAAVYAMDRTVLKDAVLTLDSGKTVKKPKELKTNSETTIPKSVPKSSSESNISKQVTKDRKPSLQTNKPQTQVVTDAPTNHPGHLTSKEADDLRKEVFKNLDDLMKIKSSFLKDFEIRDSSEVKKKSRKEEKKQKKENKKEGLADRKSNLKIVSSSANTTPSESQELENFSRNIKKEQTEIIERFINEQPVLKRNKIKDENGDQSDLSLESVEFGKDLVSENLAQILIKQGKKQKAIDIYKKLIWKYPQKKAYFASQIESLTEK